MNEHIEFPTNRGETSTYTAASGQTVTLTNIDTNTWEIRLSNDPHYRAVLEREGKDFFNLTPAPGVFALGGTGIYQTELVKYF